MIYSRPVQSVLSVQPKVLIHAAVYKSIKTLDAEPEALTTFTMTEVVVPPRLREFALLFKRENFFI